jgi:hypothetical protein
MRSLLRFVAKYHCYGAVTKALPHALIYCVADPSGDLLLLETLLRLLTGQSAYQLTIEVHSLWFFVISSNSDREVSRLKV